MTSFSRISRCCYYIYTPPRRQMLSFITKRGSKVCAARYPEINFLGQSQKHCSQLMANQRLNSFFLSLIGKYCASISTRIDDNIGARDPQRPQPTKARVGSVVQRETQTDMRVPISATIKKNEHDCDDGSDRYRCQFRIEAAPSCSLA